jgi:predicted dehydrogenase/threonine dehydrogenase-like Zn-dependent dehydrogenase
MKQVFLGGDGQVEVLDTTVPARLLESYLVRNAYSVISSGTEGAAVTRRGGLIGAYEKAVQSRHRIGLVWQMTKNQGLSRTAEQVRGKLADFSALGYSAAGVVVETDENGLGLKLGDRVAYMGTGLANHAQYGVATRLLSAKIPQGVPLDQSSFAALASIAMQGIRRAQLTSGEKLLVVGLGLIGQLAVRLGTAMGYQVYGTDLDAHRMEVALKGGAVRAWGPDEGDPTRFAGSHGFDGAIICAGTKESTLVNAIFDLMRKGGRISVVGDIGLDLDRAKMYRKELELRLSCSYGPGRYDPDYELFGNDYPIQHARWTEGRNLEYFIELLASRRIDLSDLVTAIHPVEEAKKAYYIVKQAKPEVFGVLLEHGLQETPLAPDAAERTLRLASPPTIRAGEGPVRIGLIGAGGYAKATHLPNIAKLNKDFHLTWISSRSSVAGPGKRFKPDAITSDYREILDDKDTEAVLISVRHAMHADIITDSLQAGKHIYVEKPMTRTVDEARAVTALAKETGLIMRVGFNRRFSPDMSALRAFIGSANEESPVQFFARCSTGSLGNDWSNTEEEGGRLLGEGTHFLDLANWFMGAEPTRLSASIAGDDLITNANAMITIDYPNEKIAQILYSTLGNKSMGKEYYEAYGRGVSGYCRDFKDIKFFGGLAKTDGIGKGNKGQLDALAEFAARIRGRDHVVNGADARAGLMATWMACAARDSAREGRALSFNETTLSDCD